MRPPWFLLDTEEERGQNSWEVLGFHHGYGQKQMVGVALASSSRQLCYTLVNLAMENPPE